MTGDFSVIINPYHWKLLNIKGKPGKVNDKKYVNKKERE